MERHRVVILGGGFGGLSAAHTLKNAPVELTLLDRCNYHLFQPLLYQVATGSLSPANIASPLRQILRRQKNTKVLLAEAVDINTTNRRVILSDGEVPYDTLIVATGSTHQYFGHDGWEKFAPGLKTVEDATAMRRRILLAFEAAERETDPAKLKAWMTFVIVGGGPTGAELAGALGEIAHDTLTHDFRDIDPSRTQIILVEGTDRAQAFRSCAQNARAFGRNGSYRRNGHRRKSGFRNDSRRRPHRVNSYSYSSLGRRSSGFSSGNYSF
jgi:NADH:ubiquinone reductase (H+-translocating)